MKPRELVDSGLNDLFRSRLDQIIDLKHPRAKRAGQVDGGFLEQTFGAASSDGPRHPPLPTRLMAGLAILKHAFNLSDERLCEGWVKNPYDQMFCGEEFFYAARSSCATISPSTARRSPAGASAWARTSSAR